ncbi:DNA internalization-related competence protein ComEC/Rec2 [Rhodohalobacter sp. SW132]|uniref:DNA internalization-related competence protein ComEC/Rec2 n=1 Tax=Rhodohalobacter sp. SW132 TaxID=2293433 RepID=UPI000E278E01|nr:DNA internalization-related competence protein ComEC/Rec2 [Rhodohalobacter sp. SW132]REL39105.1 DNA internalization-related competence protein ComEC/Rec2 [Rhodohalobacter sp. SW132]
MDSSTTYQFPFASLPALRIVLLMIAGIIAAYFWGDSLTLWQTLGVFTTACFMWIGAELLLSRKLTVWRSTVCTLFYLVMVVLFGAGMYQVSQERLHQTITKSDPLTLYEWETVQVSAKIKSGGRSQSGRDVYEASVSKTVLPEGALWYESYKIRLYGSDEDTTKLTPGTMVVADVRLYAFPEVRNPHDFDYGGWLHGRGITSHGEIEAIHSISENRRIGWEGIRSYVQGNIDRMFDAERAPLAKALMIGYKEELTNEERLSFSRSGLSHIMAVSGMHVGFIIAPFWLLIPWFWRWKWGKLCGLIAMTLLLIGYAGLTGFSASVCRASIMAWLLTYGKLYHKLRHSVNLLAVAAIILLIIQPSQLFDVGFQLSFSAVMIILLIMPEAQKLIPLKIRYTWKGGLLSVIWISVIVQLGLLPILALYFGEFSFAGPAANAAVVPLLSIAVPVGLAGSFLYGVLPGISEWMIVPVQWVLQWIGSVAFFFGDELTGYVSIENPSIWLFMIWITGILGCAGIKYPSVRWKMLILLLLSINLFLIEKIKVKTSTPELIVTVLDVGQGDAVHIQTPGGRHYFVDAGRWNPMGNSGERVLIPFLEHYGIRKLDGVILSHPHADHIGGLPSLMRHFPIDAIYHSDYPYDSRLYETYNRLADELEIPIVDVLSGDMIELDPLTRIFVLGPEKDVPPDRNPNNHSLSFRLQYGETSFLFTGDAEVNQERQLAERYGDFLDVNWLKTGHHGSRTSSTPIFIEQVRPEIAVTSVAFHNRFSHPNRDAVLNVKQAGAKKYFTSLSGALIFSSDGEQIRKKEIKQKVSAVLK